jgi:hypothetical protein
MKIIKKRPITLESELQRAHKQFAENRRQADQMLWHARAVSEVIRKRAMASTKTANWLSGLVV